MMNISYELLNAAAQFAAERMVDSLLVGLALAVFAFVLLRLLPRPNSATRFAVWFTALLATAFLSSLGSPRQLVANLAPAPRPWISVPSTWALYLASAWAIGAGLAMLRVVVGYFELRRLRRSCRPINNADPAWQATVDRLWPERRVEILTSDRIHVPTALGFLRPAVIIPASLLDQLSSEELKHVLLHELAHLHRWDDWTNLVQIIVKALLFFHPAVWWIEERISLEREMACDDAVLAETSNPRAYAACLATLAEKSFLRHSAALAQAAVNRIRQTTLRVAQILDVNRPIAAPARKSAVALVGAFACACLGVASQVPRMVSFEGESPAFAAVPATPAVQDSVIIATSRIPQFPKPTNAAAHLAHPQVIQASVRAPSSRSAELPRRANQARLGHPLTIEPRLVHAKAAVCQHPAFTTGVLIIVVDDPVFGPTPIVYRFAVWQVAPSKAVGQETPQKIT
jgi:bla regulator protein blaR1